MSARFFEYLGKHCKDVEAVALYLNTPFDLEVKPHYGQAEVVCDHSMSVARYGRALCRVSVDWANESNKASSLVNSPKEGDGCCWKTEAILIVADSVFGGLIASQPAVIDGWMGSISPMVS